jgi:L-lactate dehydrogenase (cytochrome)
MARVLDIAEMKALARRRVPKLFFDYADSGSFTESTYRANEADFGGIKFRQRVLVDMAERSLETTMIGERVAMPVALAPTGLCGMQHADGEILAARAAEAFGVPFVLSTMSICSIEDVAAATTRPFWFQLYVMRDRDFVAALIDRAKAAAARAAFISPSAHCIPVSPTGESATGIETSWPIMVEARLRPSMSTATRWRRRMASKSEELSRKVCSVHDPLSV